APSRTLKERPGVRTILATDIDTGAEVVVKVSELPDDGDGSVTVGHEASVLVRLEGPYVAPLWDHGRDEEFRYVVTPLVPGISLERKLEDGRLTVRDAVTVGTCLMRALLATHDLGVIHRDVKPSNIIVGDTSPIEIATLIDFDLAQTDDLGEFARDVPAGTARYMA